MSRISWNLLESKTAGRSTTGGLTGVFLKGRYYADFRGPRRCAVIGKQPSTGNHQQQQQQQQHTNTAHQHSTPTAHQHSTPTTAAAHTNTAQQQQHTPTQHTNTAHQHSTPTGHTVTGSTPRLTRVGVEGGLPGVFLKEAGIMLVSGGRAVVGSVYAHVKFGSYSKK